MTATPQAKRRKHSPPPDIDDANASTSASSSAATLPDLSQFWRLPSELASRIITLACSTPLTSSASSNASVDAATADSLSLTSSIFHAHANATLWRAIRITRPSTLDKLHQVLSERPELGQRIKSLHVGPDEEGVAPPEPHRWEKTGAYACLLFMRTSLRSAEEAKLLPRWCSPGQEWRLDVPPSDCCRSIAVFDAMREAQRSLGVDLTGGGSHFDRTFPRLYEAQAALDLYLMQMRRVEADPGFRVAAKRSGCDHDGECPRYPALLIIETAKQPTVPDSVRSDASKTYILTRQQLIDHLDRRGSPQDQFNHPLVLARSQFEPINIRAPDTQPTRWTPDVRRDIYHVFPIPASRAEEPNFYGSGPRVKAVFFNSLMVLLRQLLVLIPTLENLSLAGLLFHGCETISEEPGPHLKALGSLSLGPPPRARQRWLEEALDFKHFQQLKALHLCGFLPPGRQLAKIGGLKLLQELRWTVTDELNEKELFRLGVLIDALIGRRGAAADAAAAKAAAGKQTNNLQPAVLKKLRFQAAPGAAKRGAITDEDAAQASSAPLPFVEVRLRPAHLQAMLDRAASLEERAGWATGTLWPGCTQTRRLLLTELPDVRSVTLYGEKQHPLYEAAREWWEEHRSA